MALRMVRANTTRLFLFIEILVDVHRGNSKGSGRYIYAQGDLIALKKTKMMIISITRRKKKA